MTDAEFAAQMDRIRVLAAKWGDVFGFDDWSIKYEYVREEFEVNDVPNNTAVATTAVNWEYRHACISWNMPRVLREDAAGLEHIFVHECCHVLAHEAREWNDDDTAHSLKHEERVVESFARAIERARRVP